MQEEGGEAACAWGAGGWGGGKARWWPSLQIISFPLQGLAEDVQTEELSGKELRHFSVIKWFRLGWSLKRRECHKDSQ